jgi:peptide deformylase
MKIEKITTKEQADTIIKYLNSLIRQQKDLEILSAPEVGLKYCVAIIRSSRFSIDLINPIVITAKNVFLSIEESCNIDVCFDNHMRYRNITILNGIEQKKTSLSNKSAAKVQHALEHLLINSTKLPRVKAANIRPRGLIKQSDMCPCGSMLRFKACCGVARCYMVYDAQN